VFRVDVREKPENLAEITNRDGVANLVDVVRRQGKGNRFE
jgi:hypothetical protein